MSVPLQASWRILVRNAGTRRLQDSAHAEGRRPVKIEASTVSRNVVLVYLHSGITSFAHQLWEGSMLTQWLYSLAQDTRVNGLAKGAEGFATLAASVLFGLLVDACPRNTMLRLGGGLGLAACMALAILVLAEGAPVQLWYCALALHGLSTASQTVVVESVFADSVPTGGRVKPYMTSGLI